MTREAFIPVSVSGGYWTGSSAVVDLLGEHQDCRVVPGEFTLFSFGQWFKEVYAPLAHGRLSPCKFRENQERFESFNKSDRFPVRAIGRKICSMIQFYTPLFFSRRAGMASKLGAQYVSACERLTRAIVTCGCSKEVPDIAQISALVQFVLESAANSVGPVRSDRQLVNVFDQLVAPPYVPYAEEAEPRIRCINVDRDWRDQYISIRPNVSKLTAVNARLGVKPWDEEFTHDGGSPIQYFLKLREMIEKAKGAFEEPGNRNRLWVDYEDVVLETAVTARRIFDFLQIDFDRWIPNTGFYPEVSRRRIGKWRRLGNNDSILIGELEELENTLGSRDS